jgi:hypothetical protein
VKVPEPPAWLLGALTPRLLDLSDSQLALWVWALWAHHQARLQGGTVNDLSPEQAERLRLATQELDTDNVNELGWQRALQIIAGGDRDRGGRMLRDLLHQCSLHLAALDEAQTRRRHSRSIAQRRRYDALALLIGDIVRARPKITLPEMLDEFRRRAHQGVIETVDDDEQIVEWTNSGRVKTTQWSSIQDRLERTRKKLRGTAKKLRPR